MISITIATYNEKENLRPLVEKIFGVFKENNMDGEIVIVDDNSPDGTGVLADDLAKVHPIQVIHRPGKLGLASAAMDGFRAARGDIVGLIDADGSHPAEAIPAMVRAIQEEGAEMAIGSRYVQGGGVENWPFTRVFISRFASYLARPVTSVRDSGSGFIMFRREIIEGKKFNLIGFKMGLEIIVRGNPRKIKEVPIIFRDRLAGKSKFSMKEVLNYIIQLFQLAKYRIFKS